MKEDIIHKFVKRYVNIDGLDRAALYRDIMTLLSGVNRDGMFDLCKYMRTWKFDNKPSAKKHHGAFRGGLMMHCLIVYMVMRRLNHDLGLGLSDDTIIIVSFGHDMCKIKQYNINRLGMITYASKYNNMHAGLSLDILKSFIKLTDEEDAMIRYHMGVFNSGEYTLDAWRDARKKFGVVQIFAYADYISTMIEEELIKKYL